MRFLGMEIGNPFTRAAQEVEVVDAQGRTLHGVPKETVQATAAVEYGVGLLSRCFMLADVRPAHPALTPGYLSNVVRDILLRGNHVAYIDVQMMDGLELHRAFNWTITGGIRRSTWLYDVTLQGPTQFERVRQFYEGIVHVLWNESPGYPWRGRSPLSLMGISSALLRNVERNLQEEMDGPIAQALTFQGAVGDPEGLVADIGAARGRPIVLQGAAQAWGRQQSGGRQWDMLRIGPAPGAAEVELRHQVGADILSALGIPSGLYVPQQGTVTREAFRQLLATGVSPLASLITHELSAKLEQPVSLSFHRLEAADVAARARAYNSLKQAGMSDDEAREHAGIVADG